MKKINPEVLSILSNRFDRQVSEADILSWIYNFEESDWEKAIALLDKVVFYSESRCIRVIKEMLTKVRRQHPDSTITIYPVAGPGKSGNVMAYLVNKDMERQALSNMRIAENGQQWSGNDIIVLLDDFVGTGGSVESYYDGIKQDIPQEHTCYCVCVSYMLAGEAKLAALGIPIFGELHERAFLQRGSVFGYPPHMHPIRDFAKKYGELTYPTRPGYKGKYTGPLGFANSQAIVCFDHTTPNNSLPILWASSKRKDNDKRWVPLFPRFVNDRVYRHNNYATSKYYWLSVARKLNDGYIDRIFNQYDKESIQLIGLLFAKAHHRSDVYISALLEVPLWEVQKLLNRAGKLKLIDKNGNTTKAGEEGYRLIKRSLKEQPVIIKDEIQNNIVYAPKEFLGCFRFHVNSVNSEDPKVPQSFAAPGCE